MKLGRLPIMDIKYIISYANSYPNRIHRIGRISFIGEFIEG
jgi:hypothetical protein